MAYRTLAVLALQAMAVHAARLMALVERATEPDACQFIPYIISACESAYPNFDNYNATGQAGCVCYAGTTWVPDRFDQAVLTCANYFSTVNQTEYTALSGLENFCHSVGNAYQGPSAPISTPAPQTTSTSAIITPMSTTSAATLPTASSSASGSPSGSIVLATQSQCSGAIDIIQSCEQQVPGFSTMNDAGQASCVCYSSSTWIPNVFDQDVSSCAQFVRTAVPSLYTVYAPLTAYCSSVGDILNASASPGPTSSTIRATTTPTSRVPTTTPPQVQSTTIVIVTPTPTSTSSSAGAGSYAAQGGIMQNAFLGFVGLVIGALAWL